MESKQGVSAPFARRGSAQTAERQRQIMQKHADALVEILAGRSIDRVVALRRLGEGFKKDAREARLNQKRLFTSFINLYPEWFTINRNTVSMDSPAAATAFAEAKTRKTAKTAREFGPIDKFLKVR